MDPNQPSSSRRGDAHQQEITPDPLAEFLAPLLTDIPPALHTSFPALPLALSPTSAVPGPAIAPIPIPTPSSITVTALTSAFASTSASTLNAVPVSPTLASVPSPASISTSTSPPTLNPPFTCQWISPNGLPIACGFPLSHNPRDTHAHFRQTHRVRGNERVMVVCRWRDCHVAPMQRGSLIRHVLSVHLGLLRWRCGTCGRVFSRRGTTHVCAEDE